MSVENHLKSMLSKEEIEKVEREVKITLLAMESLKNSIREEIKKIMDEKGLRFSDIRKALDTSNNMTAKILRGGTLDFEIISKISSINGKIPKIVWVDPEETN